MMTTPAAVIKNEMQELIQAHVESFGQTRRLSCSELSDCHDRAEKIRLLGHELDRITQEIIMKKHFGRAA